MGVALGRIVEVAPMAANDNCASRGLLLRRYVHGAGVDEPWVWYEGASVTSTARRFLHPDHQGSVVAVSDNAGALLNANAYDPYGVPASSNLGRFQYTGQAWLPELALYHYKARAYSPALGRFLQTDPVGYEGGDFNLYAYVANDPLNRADPTGFCDTFVNCLTGGTFANGDGTVTVESSVVLRALVPGQVQWDAARTDWANGNELEAVGHAGLMVAEQVATVATLGTGSVAGQGARASSTAAEARAVPNPYGRAGGPAHQARVNEVASDVESRGLEAVREHRVLTPGGARGSRYVDVAGRDPATGGIVEMHQVGRQTSTGQALARERQAIQDIEQCGVGVQCGVQFHPYN
jgi:RHS repeat-associated protein